MSIRVRRYQPDDLPRIERLNARLRAAGVTDRVWPETAAPRADDPLLQELWVAVDEDEVRGAVWLHEHDFLMRGAVTRAGWFKYPVAESLIDRAYGGVPGALLIALLRRQPRLMALGMGGHDGPLARLLRGVGWTMEPVAFHLTTVRLGRVLTQLGWLRRRRSTAALGTLAARSGLAALVGGALNVVRGARIARETRGTSVEVVASFGAEADEVWQRDGASYAFIARRDAAMLNRMYPAEFPALTRLRVMRDGQTIGWLALTLSSRRVQSGQFGDLRVGMIADALGAPDDAAAILGQGVRWLRAAGADLIVTNQAHARWRAPLRRFGFVTAPTNFLLASSKAMSKALAESGVAPDAYYINRGDCDGPPRW